MPAAGTFHFAWVDETETTFNPATHNREDESIFSFTISQREGQFAEAQVEIENPEEGLLKVGREQYAWISVTKDAVTTALFFGRVTAFPDNITGETVTLTFASQFPGWEAALNTLFQSLKVEPFWDPAFIATADIDKPESALEALPSRYHFNRTTGEVTVSDILTGASTATISNHFREPLSVSKTGSPARRVKIVGEVAWEQRLIGTTSRVNDAIRTKFEGLAVNSMTGQAIVESWPRPGDSFGGSTGYEIVGSSISETTAISPFRNPVSVSFHQATTETERARSEALFGQRVDSVYSTVPRRWYRTRLTTRYDFSQSRSETITGIIENDVQALSFDQDGGKIEINLTAEDVVGLGLMPASLSSYFLTARGVTSWKHLLARAKAQLAISARAIEITFEIPFWDGLGLSCRNGITLIDSRLPGGQATGKIIAYELSVVGDTGELSAEVTIGVSVGNGASYSPAGTAPDYCDTDYVGLSYQTGDGEQGAGLGGADIIYQPYGHQKPIDPLIIQRLRNGDVVQNVTIENQPSVQNAALLANQYPSRNNAAAVLAEVQTKITVELRELKAEDNVTHAIVVNIPKPWAAPKGIDLAAAHA
jgi:hypothetical protein